MIGFKIFLYICHMHLGSNILMMILISVAILGPVVVMWISISKSTDSNCYTKDNRPSTD